jgi:hypothetical protein
MNKLISYWGMIAEIQWVIFIIGCEFNCMVHLGSRETIQIGNGIANSNTLLVGDVRVFHHHHFGASNGHCPRTHVP